MKIFIMDTIEQPRGSGWTTHKWELARNLSKSGYQMHAMTFPATKPDGVVTHSMKPKETYKFSFIFKIMHLINILKVVYAHNFDILYTRKCVIWIIRTFDKKSNKIKIGT